MQSAIECPVETLQLLPGPPPTTDDHPGWDISDDIELPPHGECRYLVELVRGQRVSVEVASAYPVEICVWDDDTYERVTPASQPDGGYHVFRPVGESSSVALAFPVSETGIYDIVVNNPEDWSIDATIRITAPTLP